MEPRTRTRRLRAAAAAMAIAVALVGCSSAVAPTSGQSSIPSCGPGGHTTQVGTETRWTPCDYDYRTAEVFIRGLLELLPTSAVSTKSIDAVVGGTELRAQQFGSAPYEGVTAVEGTLVAVWMPAPVTCVTMTWEETAWRSAVIGELVTGGC